MGTTVYQIITEFGYPKSTTNSLSRVFRLGEYAVHYCDHLGFDFGDMLDGGIPFMSDLVKYLPYLGKTRKVLTTPEFIAQCRFRGLPFGWR
jgi:hypothetical protein